MHCFVFCLLYLHTAKRLNKKLHVLITYRPHILVHARVCMIYLYVSL
jgi:hypothetical protein